MRLDCISAIESVISEDLEGPCAVKVARTVWRGKGRVNILRYPTLIC